ncbi:MAG: reprolysin-like metallopeptidase, partial [Bacteroidota bacterium]
EEQVRAELSNQHTTSHQRGAAADMRTYRIAIASAFEYSRDWGEGTVDGTLSRINTVLNRLNQVLEREIRIKVELIPQNDQLIFTDENDPFSRNVVDIITQQNQPVFNGRVGAANYDVGQTIGVGLGGLARVNGVCDNGLNRTAAYSGTSGVYVDPFFYILVAHEFGHQMGSRHSFDFCNTGGASDNASPTTGFEPGSGSTIMGYGTFSGCQEAILPGRQDEYFHAYSIDAMDSHLRNGVGSTCGEQVMVANTVPMVSINHPNGFSIPPSTPFKLEGTAMDDDGDPLTYCWEQYDTDPAQMSTLGAPQGNDPMFRSYPPTFENIRYFPKISDVANNLNDPHEVLVSYSRDMTFRLTARDNSPNGGATGVDEVQFNIVADNGPFQAASFNFGSRTFSEGDEVTILWNVAGTDQAPFNVPKVNLLLSVDGGLTFPITLLSETDNDGEAMIVIPNVNGDKM